MEEAILVVFTLLEKSGDFDYIGEDISQLDHALQSAHLARQSEADSEVVLAALFHDIGHFCCPEAQKMDDLGVMNHEDLGGKFLLSLGFSPRMANLVAGHVNAKRYLVSTRASYKNTLSEASKRTLEFQGGLMSEDEIKKFEAETDFRNLLKLRAWDDQAKVKDLKVPGLESYRDFAVKNFLVKSTIQAGHSSIP